MRKDPTMAQLFGSENVLQLNLIGLPLPMAINPTQINRDSNVGHYFELKAVWCVCILYIMRGLILLCWK